MKIRYTTTVEGKVWWEGDTIIYGDKHIPVVRHGVYGDLQGAAKVEELMLIDVGADSEVDPGHVLQVD